MTVTSIGQITALAGTSRRDLNATVVRYLPNGTVDPSFTGPVIAWQTRPSIASRRSPFSPTGKSSPRDSVVVIQPNGEILVVGDGFVSGGGLKLVLARYLAQ